MRRYTIHFAMIFLHEMLLEMKRAMERKLYLTGLIALVLAGNWVGGMAQQIDSLEICSAVQGNMPFNPARQFELRERAYCWLKISEARPGDFLKVHWLWGGELQHEEVLRLGDESWRTHCYKTLYYAGRWTVKIYTSDGLLIAEESMAAGDDASLSLPSVARTLPVPEVSEGMPQPAPLEQPRSNSTNVLRQGSWFPPSKENPGRESVIWVVLPSHEMSSEAVWVSISDQMGDSLLNDWVMLVDRQEMPEKEDWNEFSVTLDQYERRILHDISIKQTDVRLANLPIFLLAEGRGADIAWAIMQRYPDRFQGAFLTGCDCGYYQQGSSQVLSEKGTRYVIASPESDGDSELDQLQASLNQLTRSNVPYQALRQADYENFDQLPGPFIRQAISYLLASHLDSIR